MSVCVCICIISFLWIVGVILERLIVGTPNRRMAFFDVLGSFFDGVISLMLGILGVFVAYAGCQQNGLVFLWILLRLQKRGNRNCRGYGKKSDLGNDEKPE